MQVVSPGSIKGKKVILRYDFDVPLEGGIVLEDFRLKAGLETLKLCLLHASQTTLIGHIGRPEGKDQSLSVLGIKKWFVSQGFSEEINQQKLVILENLRFNPKEEAADLEFARELAKLGEVYINEAFAAYRPAASTTVLPTLLPSFAGLNFAKEIEVLTKVRNNPDKPLVVIIGGAKVEDKLAVVLEMAKIADAVLVGGKLPIEIKDKNLEVPKNVFVAKLNEDETDLAPETVEAWTNLISQAKQVIWNGPLGKMQNAKLKIENLGTEQGTYEVAQLILNSEAQTIIGGGDTIAVLNQWGILDKFSFSANDSEREDERSSRPSRFISTGGGAMLKFLETGSLPSIEALK
ncbi:MAG: phosphoglycerate kinase [Candidatus Daviesbacteria bacterium]|nr:phosphoglycerate kinase [Candidatus Daviesbacteria bacterium]